MLSSRILSARTLSAWAAAGLVGLTVACGGHKGAPATTPSAPAPQISCPADIAVGSVPSGTQAITFDAPGVSGGTAPVTTTCVPASGAAFPLGTTAVNCTAADATARKATCAFNVSLKGFSIPITTYDAIGDSLTAGENGLPSFVDLPNAYPTRLQADFDASYPGQGIVVTSHSDPGQPIGTTLAKLPGYLSDHPGAVLLLGGYNDLANACNTSACKNAAVSQLALGVRDCIKYAKEHGGVQFVFVSTLTPPGPSGQRRIAGDLILQANAAIRPMVAAQGGILVDTYPVFIGHESDYVETDGLHLTPAGYQALADAFFSAIQAKIPQTPLLHAR